MKISTSYPDLPYTNFPEEVDSFPRFEDPSIEDIAYINQYYSLIQAGDKTAADQLIIDHNLQNKQWTARLANQLRDANEATQRFFRDNVEEYLVYMSNYRGDWNQSTRYQKYDVVMYSTSEGIYSAYISVKQDIPIGTPPTNTNYFVPFTLVGPQGASGTGFAYCGQWLTSSTYNKDDMVVYNNFLWAATQTNNNSVPSDANPHWDKVVSISPSDIGAAPANHTHTAAEVGAAETSHAHATSDITSGTLAVSRGGTGYSSITDTTYTTARYRASALFSSERTPTTNGVINWTYE